jgi:hypothetical protein
MNGSNTMCTKGLWWAAGSIEMVAAFVAPAASGLAAGARGGARRAGLGASALLAPRGLPSLAAERRPAGDAEGWGLVSERDQAMGFLEAGAAPVETKWSETAEARAARLAALAREALEAAHEAEERARRVKAMSAVTVPAQAPKPRSNGLSGMLSPVALQMAAGQGEYLRRCPIRQMQEDLAEIRCGVMNIVGNLGPANLLALGAFLYAISVIQLSL